MSLVDDDPIARFYSRHPYPPPVSDLSDYAHKWQSGTWRRVEHHRLWPSRPFGQTQVVLVAGCGTTQAARHAVRNPKVRVVGIDVSATSIEHTELLIQRHQIDNLEVHRMRIEDVSELGERFDHVVCTGVLHHLEDPAAGLRALQEVMAAGGALQLMVYARHGRTGVAMMQDYCRRLGVSTGPEDMEELLSTLRELPDGHPIRHVLRTAPDFRDNGAIADALLNPREAAYTVPEVLDLLAASGLRFGRWTRQAPYSPRCGSLASLPHGRRIAGLAPADQYAAVELFRGTMARHSLVAYRSEDDPDQERVDFESDAWRDYAAIKPGTVMVVEERLPDGAAAALLNRAHEYPDLVLFVDDPQRRAFDAIDGTRTLGEIAPWGGEFFAHLWEHDLVMLDTSQARRQSG